VRDRRCPPALGAAARHRGGAAACGGSPKNDHARSQHERVVRPRDQQEGADDRQEEDQRRLGEREQASPAPLRGGVRRFHGLGGFEGLDGLDGSDPLGPIRWVGSVLPGDVRHVAGDHGAGRALSAINTPSLPSNSKIFALLPPRRYAGFV
jgi:hypothetical protein